MKIIAVSLIVFLPTLAIAQDEEIAKEGKMLTVGLNYSPDICFRTLSVDPEINDFGYLDSRNYGEKAKYGHHFGLDIKYPLTSRIRFKTGLFIADEGYSIKDKGWNTDGIFYDGRADVECKFHSLQVPLMVEFSLSKNKWKFFLSIGASADILFNNTLRIEITYWDESTETQIFNRQDEPWWFYADIWRVRTSKFYLTAMATAGIEYDLTPRIGMRFEPNFSYNLISTFDAPVNEYLLSGGLNFGIYYNLGNKKEKVNIKH